MNDYKEIKELKPIQEWHGDYRSGNITPIEELNKYMTQSEFIKEYCEKSNITEEKLNKSGQFAIPCVCDDKDCNGWAMITGNHLQAHIDLYLNK